MGGQVPAMTVGREWVTVIDLIDGTFKARL
jgi:hypothetical protein